MSELNAVVGVLKALARRIDSIDTQMKTVLHFQIAAEIYNVAYDLESYLVAVERGEKPLLTVSKARESSFLGDKYE